MLISVVEYSRNKNHVVLERNTKNVVVETNSINSLQDFYKNENMHNSAFRYKLDTSCKMRKVLIYKLKLTF